MKKVIYLQPLRNNLNKGLLIEITTVFMVLFAVIDIMGSVPIIIKFKRDGLEINPLRITLASFIILLTFLFGGKLILGLFGVDISSFAIAGSIVIFIIALEMILDVKIFRTESPKSASIVPLAFPLIAGTGSITTLLSLRADYSILSIIVALALNMVVVYLVLRLTNRIEKIIGNTGLQILKKIFGIILLAIAIKLFISNTGIVISK
jgi:multiple antibiotic resistance protein